MAEQKRDYYEVLGVSKGLLRTKSRRPIGSLPKPTTQT